MKNIYGRRQRGFSAIIAVVLIVLLALLGAYMATISGVQSITTTLSAGGMQAWFAAKAGAEWGIFQVTETNNCPGVPVTLSLESNASGYTVQIVECIQTSIGAPEGPYEMFRMTVTASRGSPGTPGFVARTVRVTATDAE